jgi:PTH1 family peptidyl-tRNA hydrolase
LKKKKNQQRRNRYARVRFIVGLGNPGLAYRDTRHNVGFMIIDRLAQKHGVSISGRKFRARCGKGRIGNDQVFLIKPQTVMNLSGLSVRDLLSFYQRSPNDMILIHDDLDLNFGTLRIKQRGGHGGHKGVESVIESLGETDFVRLKVGIGRPLNGLDARGYVLQPFNREQKGQLVEILVRAVNAIEMILLEGVERAMSVFNTARICEKKDK